MSLRAPLLYMLLTAAVSLMVSTAPALAEPPAFRENELLIKFKASATQGEIQSIRAALRATRLKHFKKIKVDHERISGVSVEQAIARFRGHRAIEYIEPNYIVHTTATQVVPNDPSFGELWGLQNTGQNGGRPGADIRAVPAWDTTTGSDILVAVIDTGVDYTHPDLAANIFVNAAEVPGNAVDDDGNGFVDDVRGWDFANDDNDPMDDNGHGTHCSGTIGAVGNNGIGVVGVNWHVRILPLKFLGAGGFGGTAAAIACIEYATMMGARVMSNSWGGGGFSQALLEAIQEANDARILFVAAAGNFGSDNDVTPFFPCNYDVPNVVSVAASTPSDDKAAFSNYGATTVHLAAPGVRILSTTPENTYSYFNGTSMAAPHVSGALALIMWRYPDLSVEHTKRLLLDSTDPLPSLYRQVQSGGRLNVARAVEGPDTIPPARIADLAAFAAASNKVRLGWTATGNNGSSGAAISYDLRYATFAIDENNFDSATRFGATPSPALSGTHQEVTVTGLVASTSYYFSIRAIDGFGNTGPASNVASATTLLPPEIEVTPGALAVSLDPDGTETRTISLRNPSAGTLDFEIETVPLGAPVASARPASGSPTLSPPGAAPAWRDYVEQANIAILAPQSTPASSEPAAGAATLPPVIVDPPADGTPVDIVQLRASGDHTHLLVEMEFSNAIDRIDFGGFLSLDTDQNHVTGVAPSFGNGSQDIGAEYEIQFFRLNDGVVSVYHAPTRGFIGAFPVTIGTTSLRFSIPLSALGEDDGTMEVTGTVGPDAGPTDWFPDLGHGLIAGGRWVAVAPTSGTLPPGGSIELQVAFASSGLLAGGYDADIRIVSNDPDEPELSVSAHADVGGRPRIDFSTGEPDFASVPLGASRADSIVVTNLGTSGLEVTAAILDNPAFVVAVESLSLAPGERRGVVVTFRPGGVPQVFGTLFITTNDPDVPELYLLLTGSGLLPPEISVSPLSLSAALISGETAVRTLEISNTGASDLGLRFTVEQPVPAPPPFPVPVSAPNPFPARAQSASTQELQDDTAVIDSLGTSALVPVLLIQDTRAWGLDLALVLRLRFGIPLRVIRSSQIEATDFSRYDVVITVGGEGRAYYEAISRNQEKFESYVRGGGIVQYQLATQGDGVNLAGSVRFVFLPLEIQNHVVTRGHPIVTGLPWILEGFFASHGHLANLPADATVITETSTSRLPTTVEYPLGLGKVIATGMPWEFLYNFGYPIGPILTQATGYSLSQVRPRWVRTDSFLATVAPGATRSTQVTFDATWVVGGAHDAILRVSSDDPDEPELLLPIHLDVTAVPEILLSSASMSFASTFVGASRTDTLEISNVGAARLEVTEISSENGVFTTEVGPFGLGSGETRVVPVTFHPSGIGSIQGALRIRSNDSDESELTVSLSGTGIPAPVIALAPSSIQASLPLGGSETRSVVLSNTGGSDLTFDLGFQGAGEAATVHPYSSYPKGAPDPRIGDPVVTRIGGPDLFGYGWVDSDQPGGPAFDWIEIGGIGTPIPTFGDDFISQPVSIGFPFPFYQNTFTSLRVCSNGFLSFTSRATDFVNQPLPNAGAPENLIAAFWDDLFVPPEGILTHTDGTRMVIEYRDVFPVFGPLDETFTFQIILYPSGEIRFQYLSLHPNAPANAATVGFQNAERNDGLMIAFNTPYVHENLAVRIIPRPRFLRVTPTSGTIPPGGTQALQATLDASGLTIGNHSAAVRMYTNDPITPVLDLPVTLRVLRSVEAVATQIEPATLNVNSRGRSVIVYVELPPGVDAYKVVLASVRFQGTLPPSQKALLVGDFNANGIPDVRFQFDRASVTQILPEGEEVAYAVTGEIQDEALFTAAGTVRIVRPHLTSPNGGESITEGSTINITWERPSEWDVKHADLFVSSDDGASWEPVAHGVRGQSFGWTVPQRSSSTARVRVDLHGDDGLIGYDSSDRPFTIVERVAGAGGAPPVVPALHQNAPNPFNPRTNIRFDLPDASPVLLTIHGVGGVRIRTLLDRVTPAGRHNVPWDGTDDHGKVVATGVYYYRLTAGAFRASRRLTLLK